MRLKHRVARRGPRLYPRVLAGGDDPRQLADEVGRHVPRLLEVARRDSHETRLVRGRIEGAEGVPCGGERLTDGVRGELLVRHPAQRP